MQHTSSQTSSGSFVNTKTKNSQSSGMDNQKLNMRCRHARHQKSQKPSKTKFPTFSDFHQSGLPTCRFFNINICISTSQNFCEIFNMFPRNFCANFIKIASTDFPIQRNLVAQILAKIPKSIKKGFSNILRFSPE